MEKIKSFTRHTRSTEMLKLNRSDQYSRGSYFNNNQNGKGLLTLVKQRQSPEDISLSQALDILKQHQKEVNEIRTERASTNANPLTLVAQQQPVTIIKTIPNSEYSIFLRPDCNSSTKTRKEIIQDDPDETDVLDQERDCFAIFNSETKNVKLTRQPMAVPVSTKRTKNKISRRIATHREHSIIVDSGAQEHMTKNLKLLKAKIGGDISGKQVKGLHAQVTTIRTDKGTEFLNKTLHAYFAKEGIKHETSTARTPEQNALSKTEPYSIEALARTMLKRTLQFLLFNRAKAMQHHVLLKTVSRCNSYDMRTTPTYHQCPKPILIKFFTSWFPLLPSSEMVNKS
ncbi:retrovirus-related pol polyprotein from transposon TNT 1-94 [Tanacetum coccineum]